MIKEYQVDAVVDVSLQACHTYAIEQQQIKRFVNQQKIAYLSLETDYSQADLQSLNIRLGAFIEML